MGTLTMKPIYKSIAFQLFGSKFRSSYRINKAHQKNILTILNLHRVCVDDQSSYKPLDPKIFEELIKFTKANYTITTFNDLDSIKLIHDNPKPFLIISFDDGYKDFIEVAVPILFKHKIKVNQNIIPECVDTGDPPLNVAVQDFIGKASAVDLRRLSIPGFDMGADLSNRMGIGLRVSAFLKNKPIVKQNEYKELILSQIGGIHDYQVTPMMNLDDIRQLIEIHELGAHSYSHASMALETDDYVKNDLKLCQEWFSKHLSNHKINIYAFPNGSYREQHIQYVRDAGYDHVLLVGDKFSTITRKVHHRFGFDAETKEEMRFRVIGRFSEIKD
jgi:peptidoglycan/xylan/chitin deacetylase (PgdA/CDA1 family)